jgi:AhpD family alkylhydroperoxidase
MTRDVPNSGARCIKIAQTPHVKMIASAAMHALIKIVGAALFLAAPLEQAAEAQVPSKPPEDPITANDRAFMTVFEGQYDKTFADGAVPAKYKDLGAAVLSVAVKCEGCLKFHIKQAIQHGATRAEIVEMMRVALVAGGSAGIPTMRSAYQAMDDAKLK